MCYYAGKTRSACAARDRFAQESAGTLRNSADPRIDDKAWFEKWDETEPDDARPEQGDPAAVRAA
ncbi:MAG: hypothetical protein A2078_06430 [Nitrospirae bacterium GWC2_57_9]|nr:MAG: hypothetical protein A2078_06430 [Nitrospirae bacterium GWC2_57_9]